jgi:hypothetical protein
MTLKSALEDVKQNTLSTVSGSLAKLVYLASLKRGNRYEHWGMENVHGADAAERAFRSAHAEIVASILKTPLALLQEDLEISRATKAISAAAYIQDMRDHFKDLLPTGRSDAPSAAHLNSVLAALSSLKQRPRRATRSVS